MKLRKKIADLFIEEKTPNRHNVRSINDLTLTFTLNTNQKNTFSDFLYNIGTKKSYNHNNNNEEIKILDIGCGTGNLLEEIIRNYDITGIGISKHPEEYSKKDDLRGKYITQTLKDALPISIEDNSLDFVISLYSLQYIQEAPKLIQDIYKKLKKGGKALLSLGTPGHIDPKFLHYIEQNNKNIIIDSSFTGNIKNTELQNLSIDDIANIGNRKNEFEYTLQNEVTYALQANMIHTLYIQKTDDDKEFHIPTYRSNKDIWYTQQEREQYPEYHIITDQDLPYKLQERQYMHDNNINLNKMSYTFSYIK